MGKVEVIIGAFRRRAFAQGLAARMALHGGLSVTIEPWGRIAPRLEDAAGPVVLIFDAADPAMDVGSLPETRSLTVIVIEDEGRRVRVLLNDIEAAQLGDIISAAAGPVSTNQRACRALAVLRSVAAAIVLPSSGAVPA